LGGIKYAEASGLPVYTKIAQAVAAAFFLILGFLEVNYQFSLKSFYEYR
jgi:hypothetical protein